MIMLGRENLQIELFRRIEIAILMQSHRLLQQPRQIGRRLLGVHAREIARDEARF
jgi:hypothetical protein